MTLFLLIFGTWAVFGATMLTAEMHRIDKEPDPRLRYVKRKAFWHGFFNWYPPLWYSEERRIEVLRPLIDRWWAESEGL